MWKRMKALGKLAKTSGLAARLARAQALRDQAMLDLAKLEEQRQLLEQHFKQRSSHAEYENSLARINADERRLLARVERYQSVMDEIDATAERYSHEAL